MSDSNVTKQARYIFGVAKMVRHHVMSSLPKVEGGCMPGDLSVAQMNLILAVRTRGEVTLRKVTKKELTDALLLKSIDYLNFSHF